MFEDILTNEKEKVEESEEKCVGQCDPDYGCACPSTDEAPRNFLLRWKRDIEDGIEEPLGYHQYLSVCRTFGDDLVNEVDIASAGWVSDEPEYYMSDRERSLSIRAARSTMSTIFKQDPDLERAYLDNIAMTIFDHLWWDMKIEVPKEARDKTAKAILKLIFD